MSVTPLRARPRDIEIAERCAATINEIQRRHWGACIDARVGPDGVILSRLSRPRAFLAEGALPTCGARRQEIAARAVQARVLDCIRAAGDQGVTVRAIIEALAEKRDRVAYQVRLLAEFRAIEPADDAFPAKWKIRA